MFTRNRIVARCGCCHLILESGRVFSLTKNGRVVIFVSFDQDKMSKNEMLALSALIIAVVIIIFIVVLN